MSREHFEVERGQERCLIRDLKSPNGNIRQRAEGEFSIEPAAEQLIQPDSQLDGLLLSKLMARRLIRALAVSLCGKLKA
jgi:hypothetical protein